METKTNFESQYDKAFYEEPLTLTRSGRRDFKFIARTQRERERDMHGKRDPGKSICTVRWGHKTSQETWNGREGELVAPDIRRQADGSTATLQTVITDLDSQALLLPAYRHQESANICLRHPLLRQHKKKEEEGHSYGWFS